jgi:hypothetical protein
LGRQLYLKAIELAKSIRSEYYYWLAILNYSREEMQASSEFAEYAKKALDSIPESTIYPEINKLREEVLNMTRNKVN